MDMTATIGSRDAKDAMFDVFARVGTTLASGRRLEIIDVLSQAPRTVEEVADSIDQSVANTSHHLRRLADDGLVRSHRNGRHITYELASDEVYTLWRALQSVAETHHNELESRAGDYLGNRGEIDVIGRAALAQRLESGDDIVVIDVRPEPEYRDGHIDGAISTPPERLPQELQGLPQNGAVVAYCRGRYCAYADQAVRMLRASGRTAYRLEEGYREWERSQADHPD